MQSAAGGAHAARLKAAVTRLAQTQKLTAEEVHAALRACSALGAAGLLAPAAADEALVTALSCEVARLETLPETDSLLQAVLAAAPVGEESEVEEGVELEEEEEEEGEEEGEGEGPEWDAFNILAQGANEEYASGDDWHHSLLTDEPEEEDPAAEEEDGGAGWSAEGEGEAFADIGARWLSAIPAGERAKLEAALAAAPPGAEHQARLLAAGPRSTIRF